MSRIFIGALCLLASPLIAEQNCQLSGYISSEVPGAPVIFDAPSATATPIGTVPRTEDADYGVMGGSFLLDNIQGDYAHITNVDAWYSSDETGPGGWILASDIVFTVQSTKGFAAADATSEVTYETDDWIYHDQIDTLLGCQDEWAHLRFTDAKGQHTAWMRGICSNQETTCDGVLGDN